eukprot:11197901-Lingulodinium_polyedra.AAC.1
MGSTRVWFGAPTAGASAVLPAKLVARGSRGACIPTAFGPPATTKRRPPAQRRRFCAMLLGKRRPPWCSNLSGDCACTYACG